VDSFVASGADRALVRRLAQRKLTGEKLQQIQSFIAGFRRSTKDLEQLRSRLECLPDLPQDANRRTRLLSVSDADVQRLRAERAAGASLRDLAARFGVSTSTVRRICAREGAA
jgi:AraC-like DNA-binding protein